MRKSNSLLKIVLPYSSRQSIEKIFLSSNGRCNPRLKRSFKELGLRCEERNNDNEEISYPGCSEVIYLNHNLKGKESIKDMAHRVINYIERNYSSAPIESQQAVAEYIQRRMTRDEERKISETVFRPRFELPAYA